MTKPIVLDENRRFVKRLATHPKAENEQAQYIDFIWRQVYVLPTMRGLYYFITVAVMFVWAVNYGLSLGYAVVFFSVMLGLIVMVMTVRNLSQIRVQALINKPFFADAEAFFDLEITTLNPFDKYAIVARRNGFYSKHGNALQNKPLRLHVPLGITQRGCHTLKYVRLSSGYPMDLFNAWVWLYLNREVVVYPKAAGDLPLPFSLSHTGDSAGGRNNQGADDFVGLRNYQKGDALKHIVWRRAQGKRLPVKQFQEEQNYHCILDFNHPQFAGLETEGKLSQLCQWVLLAESSGISYELRLPHQVIAMNHGFNHQHQCLQALARF